MSNTSNYVTNPSDLLASKPFYVYEILGCSEKENFEGPQVAYLCLRYYALSRIFNPAYANPFNEDQKKYFDKMYDAVNIAFIILSNPDYKAKYDQAGTVDLHAFLRNIGITSEDELQSFCKGISLGILGILDTSSLTPGK
ncbi:hypothetical protein [Absidia glauca]|uniref:J domain-containing protein n=1 Tax=Absidia glauca TaxID=4829 RepID=A0A168LSK1_ABSGL|nr:hypothetical protein [Absidia glauca]